MKRITKIEASKALNEKKLRVAAYARVSTDSEEQLISLNAQKEHYEDVIRSNPKWEYAGLYYDEGISGTKMAKRDGLLRMLSDCEAGKIDYIIVKSISRFSRNTLESIETIRRLCSMNVYIFFEKENIDTGKMEGELMLSILSSLAESESRSLADNVKWSIQSRFKDGTYKIGYAPYGYKVVDGELVIDEEKAPLIKRIFAEVLEGNTPSRLATQFNKEGIPPVRGKKWHGSVILKAVRNEKYCGDVLLQKTYTDSNFNRHVNYGEKDQYYIKDHHEPIISREDFEAANRIIDFNASEKNIVAGSGRYSKRYVLSGIIVCGECGNTWKRRMINGEPYYVCSKHLEDRLSCKQLSVRGDSIEKAFITMMNKLTYARKEILLPLQDKNLNPDAESAFDRMSEIEKEIDAIIERKQSAQRFFSKGLIDPAIFAEEFGAIEAQEKKLTQEYEHISKEYDSGGGRRSALCAIIKYTAKGEMLTEYAESLLEQFVDHIVIYSRNEIGFVMKCGPEFKERMN